MCSLARIYLLLECVLYRKVHFSEYDVHLLDFMGIGYNFGHFLMDHMLPALRVLQLWDLTDRIDDTQGTRSLLPVYQVSFDTDFGT